MKDSWFNHNTDKILLVLIYVMTFLAIIYFFHHHGDEKLMDWSEGVAGTILGALIMVLTGRVNRADGQTSNGVAPNPPAASGAPPAGSAVLTETKQIGGANA